MSTPTAEELESECAARHPHDYDGMVTDLAQRLATALAEVERLRVDADLAKSSHTVVTEALRQERQRAVAAFEALAIANACRSCKGTGAAPGRVTCVCGGSGQEDEAHSRLIDRSFDYDMLTGKLAEVQQRAEAAEHKLECAEIAEKTWREDHQRAIAIAQDAHVKLAEAQQREAWWRELNPLEACSGGWKRTELRRYRELRRLLGLDNG